MAGGPPSPTPHPLRNKLLGDLAGIWIRLWEGGGGGGSSLQCQAAKVQIKEALDPITPVMTDL